MATNLPGHYSNVERVAWRFPTSDVIGSHIREDADSYLALLRRKIQEKYVNNQELIKGILLWAALTLPVILLICRFDDFSLGTVTGILFDYAIIIS